jgi:CRISPR/Cas system-associated endonuclease Cas1
LIGQKLEAQQKLARDGLSNSVVADAIGRAREAIPSAETIDAIRLLESRGAYAYWDAWDGLPINFPKSDLRRVPEHWRTFRNRISPLTGSPRLAANPINAMLNYFYALLESEARLAVAALGLDPGLGVLHMDAPARDSLACDVEAAYLHEIQPKLKTLTLSVLASRLGISIPYAVDVRSARRIPHPRHWETLAQLVGFRNDANT